ncbi:flagellar protein FlgN [Ammoniphilus sp. 3BR4]|uniref:flagellar protein FlgN n=1 Tax=Ammoniphilus sp. 3BR4 TaxID=3158265 RepID=UPI003467E99A
MDSLQKIETCLMELLSEHHTLLEMTLEKKRVLIHGPIHELPSLLAKESPVIKRIQFLEEHRQYLLKDYFKKIGVTQKTTTLSEFIGNISHPGYQRSFAELGSELGKVLCDLKFANDLNNELVEQSMAFIQDTLEVLMEDHQMDMTYGKPLKARTSYGHSFFNNRA